MQNVEGSLTNCLFKIRRVFHFRYSSTALVAFSWSGISRSLNITRVVFISFQAASQSGDAFYLQMNAGGMQTI